MVTAPARVAALAAALVLVGCTPAAPEPEPTVAPRSVGPVPEPSRTPEPTPSASATPSPGTTRYSTTVGPVLGLKLECRPITPRERALFVDAGAIERAVAVDFGEPWRVIVYGVRGELYPRQVVTNGTRFADVGPGWGGGYYALDVQLADGPAARAAAEACHARG